MPHYEIKSPNDVGHQNGDIDYGGTLRGQNGENTFSNELYFDRLLDEPNNEITNPNWIGAQDCATVYDDFSDEQDDEIAHSNDLGSKENMSIDDWINDENHLRCEENGCEDKTFKSPRELKRHKKGHDSNAQLWYCGCCLNMERTYKGKYRKDKVVSHL